MTKPHLSHLPEGLKPDRELPPELEALFHWANLMGMTAREIQVWTETRNALIRKHAARLREYGVDAEKWIAYFGPSFESLAKSQLKMAEINEQNFKSPAEKNASIFEVLMSLEPAITTLSEQYPSDPLFRDMKDTLKDWRERIANRN